MSVTHAAMTVTSEHPPAVREGRVPTSARRAGDRRLTAARIAPGHVVIVAIVGLLVTACGSTRIASDSSRTASLTPNGDSGPGAVKQVAFEGVRLTIPDSWPVIDGAHAHYPCGSTFEGQADKAFLGVTYQAAPSCAPSPQGTNAPPADGIWMQPARSNPPSDTPTILSGGRSIYVSTDARAAVVTAWYHHVMIQIGIGPDPAVERQILDSMTFQPAIPDTPVLGRCPTVEPGPPAMPGPTRLTAPLTLGDSNAHLQPEPSNISARVSAATVWASAVHDLGAGRSAGPLQWSITFGSYSAQTPATLNADGSTTPDFQGVPTWLIRGEGIQTPYGPCGTTVLAPYNADTGQSMGMETIG